MKTCICLFLTMGMGISCSNDGKTIERLQQQNDSLAAVSQQQQGIIDNLTTTMEEITLTMDTIASQERVVLTGVDERGVPLTRRNMKAKLEALSTLIRDQHNRLDSLGKALEGSQATTNRLRNIINMLTASLDERTRELDSLKTVLAYKEIDINKLGAQVATLTDTVNTVRHENAAQRQTIARQEQSISRQDEQLHEVFYIIGTKDELAAAGVVTRQGGLFSKKKVNFADMDKSTLTKADMRRLRTLTIPSKNAKILGDVPQSAFTLTKGDKTCTLNITNPERFWSSNNKVLVIQVK